MNIFSSKNRSSVIDQVSQSDFDLLVIGGGITGAGIALDAAGRGEGLAELESNNRIFIDWGGALQNWK